VAQSPVSHQAAADALPMRDAFSVLFFVSVGMLFDPSFLVHQPLMVAAALVIVMLAKPLAALVIVAVLGYSARTALTVALALSQIGEFSFIVSQVAREHGLMSENGHNVLVAAAMISITLNPLVFRSLDRVEAWARGHPRVWGLVNGRADRYAARVNTTAATTIEATTKPLAIIVGHGPVGRVVDALLRDAGMETVIVEMNMDTVKSLVAAGHAAIFGDATRREVLEQAGAHRASHLVVTLPHSSSKEPLICTARELNPGIDVTVRARYLAESESLRRAGASKVVVEEGEAGLAMARHVLERREVARPMIDNLLGALRRLWKMDE
jgi:CPA2 family monovalent cation:H+ antiporter-2